MKYFCSVIFLFSIATITRCDALDSFLDSNEIDYTDSNFYRLEAGYAAGKFIGIERNYAELGLMFFSQNYCGWKPFVDIRGYRLNNGDWAASAGLGVRSCNSCFCHIWGANLYYDYRDIGFGHFNRLGIGLEALGPIYDFRINGYFPISNSVQHSKKHFFKVGDFFAVCREKEFVFVGFDSEIGWNMFCLCNQYVLYGAVGPYYYHRRRDHIFGGQARLEFRWLQYLTLEARVSHDHKFKTHFQGKLMFQIPLDLIFCFQRECRSCCDLCTQPVKRNGLIFTDHCCDWEWNW